MAVVQFDVDGVLADFTRGFTDYGARIFSDLPRTSDERNSRYGTAHVVGVERNRAIWDKLLDDTFFWEELPAAVPRAVFKRISDLQDASTVYFATNRIGRHAKAQTENWLRAHGVDRPTVVTTARKGEFAHAIGATHAIEDKAGNAVYIAYESPSTRSFLIDRPYNQFDATVLGSKVTRVDTIDAFLNAVDEEGNR